MQQRVEAKGRQLLNRLRAQTTVLSHACKQKWGVFYVGGLPPPHMGGAFWICDKGSARELQGPRHLAYDDNLLDPRHQRVLRAPGSKGVGEHMGIH